MIMENEILNIIKDVSYPAAFVIFLLIVIKPLMPFVKKWISGKTNGVNGDILKERFDELEGNHLGELKDILIRIEKQLGKLDDIKSCINYIKGKLDK